MTAEYTGRGDPERSMSLLWGTGREGARGPKRGLSVERIVAAAVAIADADGLAALSMRKVAEALGVGVMSLYTYVPGKAELLDVMLDRVVGEQAPQGDDPSRPWRARLEERARVDWDLYRRHPWILQVSSSRALLGPNEMAAYEATLRTVAGLGLSGREMVSVVSLVRRYVRGAAQAAAEAEAAARQTGMTDEEWWEARAPILERLFDPTRYPTVTAVQADGGFDPLDDGGGYTLQLALDDFAFGLQRVLDGVEKLVADRAGGSETP